jgi:hypothetical protein
LEVVDLTGQLTGVVTRIKEGNPSNGASSGCQTRPKWFNPDTERRDDPHTGNDNPLIGREMVSYDRLWVSNRFISQHFSQ